VGPWFGGTEATDHEAKQRSRVNRKKAKTVLRLPDLEHAKAAVLNSLTSADAQRGYRHAIDEFVDWYCSEPRLAFNRIVVLRYRSYLESRQLAPGRVNLRLGAVRRLAYEAADCGLLSLDRAAGIRRVKGVKKLSVRLGNWLTAEQAHSLWQSARWEAGGFLPRMPTSLVEHSTFSSCRRFEHAKCGAMASTSRASVICLSRWPPI